ncbi:hypothetical protein STEG23_007312, partial [Scotinomys teguina]
YVSTSGSTLTPLGTVSSENFFFPKLLLDMVQYHTSRAVTNKTGKKCHVSQTTVGHGKYSDYRKVNTNVIQRAFFTLKSLMNFNESITSEKLTLKPGLDSLSAKCHRDWYEYGNSLKTVPLSVTGYSDYRTQVGEIHPDHRRQAGLEKLRATDKHVHGEKANKCHDSMASDSVSVFRSLAMALALETPSFLYTVVEFGFLHESSLHPVMYPVCTKNG